MSRGAGCVEATDMKILLSTTHRYPAGGRTGSGLGSNSRAGGGAAYVHDYLAKGLAELGHDVYTNLGGGFDPPLAAGVRYVSDAPPGIDILHQINAQFLVRDWPEPKLRNLKSAWLATCHIDATGYETPPAGHRRGAMPPNWVTVSESLARAYGHGRFITNGVDPGDLIYSSSKDGYYLFCSRADVADQKGLAVALALSRATGVPLTVMASSSFDDVMARLGARCEEAGARFVGDLRGQPKAEVFAGARALVFPTEYDEGCPIVIAEALMSGTPVICSPRGACPEMVTPDVGFVCGTWDEYLGAAERLESVRPEDCRRRAMTAFHYLEMASRYVDAYTEELEAVNSGHETYFRTRALGLARSGRSRARNSNGESIAGGLGVDDVHRYHEDGVLYPVVALDADEVDFYRARVDELDQRVGGLNTSMKVVQPQIHFRWAYDLATNPTVLDAVTALIGPDVLVHSASIFCKNPGDGRFVAWHQDGHYWRLSEPRLVSAWIALSDSTRESGCMRVVRGSHRERLPHVEQRDASNMLASGLCLDFEIDPATAEDVVLRPGEMSLHHERIVHGSEPNRSNHKRVGFAVRYAAPEVSQAIEHHDVILARGRDRFGHFVHLVEPPGHDIEQGLARCQALGDVIRRRRFGDAPRDGGRASPSIAAS